MEAYGHTLAVAYVGLGLSRSIREVSNIDPNHKTPMNETYQTNGEVWLKELADKYVKLLDRMQFLSYKKEYSPSDFIASEHAKASEEMENVKKSILEIINRK